MFQDFLTWLNDFMYTYILIFLLVGCGLYYSIRTRFVQVRKIKDVLSILKEKANSDGSDTQQVSSCNTDTEQPCYHSIIKMYDQRKSKSCNKSHKITGTFAFPGF